MESHLIDVTYKTYVDKYIFQLILLKCLFEEELNNI